MHWKLWVISMGVVAGITGCSNEPTRAELLKKEKLCLACYCSSNPLSAEAAFLDCERYVLKCQAHGLVGPRYDEILARLYGRLALVERRLGKSGEADRFLVKAAEYCGKTGTVRPGIGLAQFESLIEQEFDKGLTVSWRGQ